MINGLAKNLQTLGHRMIMFRFFLCLNLAVAGTFIGCDPEPEDHQSDQALTDQVAYINGKIYTGKPGHLWAEAFIYDGERFTYVGSDAGISLEGIKEENIIDLEKSVVMPGFQDAHVHALEAGLNEDLCLLETGSTIDIYESTIKNCKNTDGPAGWILGAGASLDIIGGHTETPRAFLDRIHPERPVLLLDDLGHVVFANSLALTKSGYSDASENPNGGFLGKDNSGKLNGIIYENAQQGLRNAAWTDSQENLAIYVKKLKKSLTYFAENGVTTISDAGGFWLQGHDKAWTTIQLSGELTIRAFNSLYLYPDLDFDTQVTKISEKFSDEQNAKLKFNQIKIYMDGIISLGTSYVKNPYLKSSEFPLGLSQGMTYFTYDELVRYVKFFEKKGFQMNIHATGDKSVEEALKALKESGDETQILDRRHRLTHLYLVDQSDISSFNELGVVADFQLTKDSLTTEYKAFVSTQIQDLSRLLRFKDFTEANVKTIISSDYDTEDLNPFQKIQRIIEQKLDSGVESVVDKMTREVAYALGHDSVTGTIEKGKYADFIVLDQDIFTIETNKISQTSVLRTVVGGKNIYTSLDF